MEIPSDACRYRTSIGCVYPILDRLCGQVDKKDRAALPHSNSVENCAKCCENCSSCGSALDDVENEAGGCTPRSRSSSVSPC